MTGVQTCALPIWAFVGVAVATLLFAAAAPFVVTVEALRSEATLWFALCGLFMPALSMILAIRSVGIVGPALTAALASSTPLFAVTLAVAALGEPFGPQVAAGVALTVAGLALAPFVRGAAAPRVPAWTLLLPLGASALRGIAQPVAKIGLSIQPSPLQAALVTFAVSTVVLALAAGPRRLRAALRPSRGLAWFAAAGAMNGAGLLLLNLALATGDVVIAAPLGATAPLWALVWGALVFGGERITLRHLGLAALVVAGSVLVVTR